MPPTFSFGKIELTTDLNQTSRRGAPEPDTPFRIALLGDFSSHGADKAGERRPLLIDRDNFDDVLAQLNVRVQLPAGVASSESVMLRFAELENFHPDRIFEQVEAFQLLDDLRRRLKNPATFETAAAEMCALISAPAADAATEQPSPAAKAPEVNTTELLDQIIEAAPGQQSTVKPDEILGDWQGFLRRLVAPHLVPQSHPQAQQLIAHIETAMSEQMRAILHDPGFQALEAAWRSAYFLTRRLDTGSDLKLYLIDISKAELAADLNSSEDLSSTALRRVLAEHSRAQPWALLAGNYTFDHSVEDAELLGRIGKIAAQTGAPFIAAASSNILGCTSLAETPDPDDWVVTADAATIEAWEALRQLPEASYLGLALPRFLLRLPYGHEAEPIERFDFEEFGAIPSHEQYLWGNAAYACAYLLAETFTRDGWSLHPGVIQEILGLPIHVYKEDGESALKPGAEVLLTERAAERMLEQGLMPLLSSSGSDVIRLGRFQSLARPLKALAGRWRG